MAVDSTGKGFIVGSTISVTPTVAALANGGQQAVVTMPNGKKYYTNNPKTSTYSAGATPTISGTVVGFIDGSLTALVKEADGNIIGIPCANCTAS